MTVSPRVPGIDLGQRDRIHVFRTVFDVVDPTIYMPRISDITWPDPPGIVDIIHYAKNYLDPSVLRAYDVTLKPDVVDTEKHSVQTHNVKPSSTSQEKTIAPAPASKDAVPPTAAQPDILKPDTSSAESKETQLDTAPA